MIIPFWLYSALIQMSYHKFNESQREQAVLKRLKQGEIVALISDAGTPCISDPGMELVSVFCVLIKPFIVVVHRLFRLELSWIKQNSECGT